jgi:hypothetical protein
VLIAVSSSGGGTNGSSCVRQVILLVTCLFEVGAEARFDKGPGTLILRLFLRPDLFGVRESFCGGIERLEGEGS